MKVSLDGHLSTSFNTKLSVGKSSILGQKLFLIFINDIPYDISSQHGIFADGTTINSSLVHKGDLTDRMKMAADVQNDIKTVVNWGINWHAIFNPSKTKLFSINHVRDPCLTSI